MAKAKVVAVIDVGKTKAVIHERALSAVNHVAREAFDKARELVPVRKVFKYRRRNVGSKLFAEQLAQGRQDVRTLSLEEALSESVMRRRLFLSGFTGSARKEAIKRGVGSAFPTDAAGRRIRSSQSLVRTAQLTDSYSSRSRTNLSSARDRDIIASREILRIDGQNRLAHLEDIVDRGQVIGQRRVVDQRAEALLSSRGRAELRRATGDTLGGALRKSITLHPADDGRRMTALITAGGDRADYAKYVEFGTRRSRAQPFMRPALAHARELYPDAMRQALKGTLFKG